MGAKRGTQQTLHLNIFGVHTYISYKSYTHSVTKIDKKSCSAKNNENVPILGAIFVSISSWHSGHTILMGYSPKLTTICCEDCISWVIALDGD